MYAVSLRRTVTVLALVVAALTVCGVVVPTVGTESGSNGSNSTPIHSEADSSTSTAVPAAGEGPHPQSIYDYEVAPGGGVTWDPDVLYDTVSEEGPMNIFQTLIAYEGNSVTGFVPEAATCVPGYTSSQPGNCVSLYGSDLVVDSAAGLPEYYTFVIGPSHFYDPATGASWQVYPSDVMFSVARSQAFFQYLGVGSTGGWDIGQEMLQENTSNKAYDGGLHYPYNNTVQGIMENMLVNATGYCPTSVLDGSASGTFGCITFNVYGGNVSWPIFEETLTQVFSGATILPCGWYTYESAGLPGFTGSSQAKGDGPCTLPGGATSTDQSSYQNWLNTTLPTAWDAVDESMINYPAPDPNVQWNVVGSGPYYEVPGSLSPGVSYQLAANPDFVQSSFCAATPLPGCQPAAGTYINHVYAYWEPSDQVGLAELAAGQADLATISSVNTSTLLDLVSQGKAEYTTTPSLTTFGLEFTLNVSITGAKGILPAGYVYNVPSNFFTSDAVRQLMVTAWPYTTAQDEVTVDGVAYGFNYGGLIPVGEGNYYPTNISWPGPNTQANLTDSNVVGSAAWWWMEGTTAGTPYYSAELAACNSTDPCEFPIFAGAGGGPLDGDVLGVYISALEKVTGGAIQPYDFDEGVGTDCYFSICPPENSLDISPLGWIPDYPDPSSNFDAMILPNSAYTSMEGLYQQLTPLNSSSCGYNTDYSSFATLEYWANVGQIPTDCQGPAYQTLINWSVIAGTETNISQRELDYNLAEHILNELALYLYVDQSNVVVASAPWISASSLNTNVMVGGNLDSYFFQIQHGPEFPVTFDASGLPFGASWSVTMGGVTNSTSGSAVTFAFWNGTYPYTVTGNGAWQIVGNGTGSVEVDGASTSITLMFQFTSAITFSQTGIPAGTAWTVDATLTSAAAPATGASVGTSWSAHSTGSTATLFLLNGTYTYAVSAPGYSTISGPLVVTGQAKTVSVSATKTASTIAWWIWASVGAGIAVTVVAVALALVWRRGNRKKGVAHPPVNSPSDAPSSDPAGREPVGSTGPPPAGG